MAGHAARLMKPMFPLMYSPIGRIGTNTCKRLQWNHQIGQSCSRLPISVIQPTTVELMQCSAIHTTQILAKKDKGKKKKGTKVDTTTSADTSILDLGEVKRDMDKALEILKHDYIKSLSIRSSHGSLDHIQVETSDGKFPLNHLAQIATKSNNMMVVNMSNFPQATEAAAQAIQQSGMNLNPEVDGHTIKVPVPKVTKEHRENLAKVAKTMCNETKVNIRNVRNKYATIIKKHGQGKSKDVVFKLEKQIQQLLDESNNSATDILAAKTKELLGK
ncbi:ribosome-recycling factor, mitochondrial-like [Amphiura filiformis]|uniref:ribosome-recycling factor, mitochondrial-like n=1 Tax=Amphiura filiformis TaxID=82378 RepID=UPI003B20F2FE